VWEPFRVEITRMRVRPDLDVTDQVDLDADEWSIVVPAR